MPDAGSRRLTAVELFAGVGGFALGLEGRLIDFDDEQGWIWDPTGGPWEVIWANQWEPMTKTQHAADCYRRRFPRTPLVDADIHAVLNAHLEDDQGEDLREHAFDRRMSSARNHDARWQRASQMTERWLREPLPETFDLLVGGFPCQDYSVAKPLSQATGIAGHKGVLWWEIERVVRSRRPPHVLLENVDRLLKSPSDQRGRDFAIMLACFAYHGYEVQWRVINAAHYGFPQRRRRVFVYARHVDEAGPPSPPNDFSSAALDVLEGWGVMAESFPCELGRGEVVSELLHGRRLIEPHELSLRWPSRTTSPWRDAGYMCDGLVYTASVLAPDDDRPKPLLGRCFTLGSVLLPVEHVLKDERLHEYLIPTVELDLSEHPRRGTWNYLKGAKSERREKRDGFVYHYTEGAIRFPEPLDQAARTILTGEGGRTPSRFKLVVAQEIPTDVDRSEWPDAVTDAIVDHGGDVVFRRVTPLELERLNMFPDGWTASIPSAGRRAFCMGNALVVGVVERLGRTIAART